VLFGGIQGGAKAEAMLARIRARPQPVFAGNSAMHSDAFALAVVLSNIAGDRSSTIVFPLPLERFTEMAEVAQRTAARRSAPDM
jgi:hypothetical protein